MARFPDCNPSDNSSASKAAREDENAAIQVFGRRFFKDQTPVEYLTEFLLVFASPKDETDSNAYSFPLYSHPPKTLSYHPRYRLALKLFSFLGASKLETRHRAHILAFREGIGELERRISQSSKLSKNDSVRLIQGVFSGFVGVAGDRTWTAHTFLPASESLLARETLWKHEGPKGAAKFPDLTWYEALTNEKGAFFNTSAHSFLARGGEHLYLQLTSLFNNYRDHPLISLFAGGYSDSYAHLISAGRLDELRERLQSRLKEMLNDSDQAIGQLGKFVNQAFEAVEVGGEGVSSSAELGWVPTATATEAALFAWEIENICRAQRSGLQKISLLRDLCVLHVMRSLCFQSARVVNARKIHNFIGNFAWIASPPGDLSGDNVRKIAINSYLELENLLYDSLRKYGNYEEGAEPADPLKRQDWLSKGDDNVRNLFRRVGKKIGVIVPRNGSGMRITLPAHIVRLLVAALVPPGTRIRLDTFYERIFSHYGLAINQDTIQLALSSSLTQSAGDAFGIDSSWFEEELRRGGYLIPLSDAVALVFNPYKA